MKCKHNQLKMGYIQAQDYADDRMKKGAKQLLCPICKRYLWPEEYFPKRKPVKALVRVKAHFFKDASGAIVAFNSKANKEFKPCFILIDKKHLKGE